MIHSLPNEHDNKKDEGRNASYRRQDQDRSSTGQQESSTVLGYGSRNKNNSLLTQHPGQIYQLNLSSSSSKRKQLWELQDSNYYTL